MVRKAFTLIELIISIVVLSFIVGFYPILSTEINKSIDFAVEQNALYSTTTRLSKIITAYWDESSFIYDPTTFTFSASQEVNASNGDAQLREVGTDSFRVGAFGTDKKRRFFRTDANATVALGFELDDNNTLGTGTYNPDDIDDFDMGVNIYESVYETGATSAAYSYKEDIEVNILVEYVNDTPTNAQGYNSKNITFNYNTTATAGPTNIKMTTITTRRATGEEIFKMRTYASNVGEIKAYATGMMP